MDDLLSEFIAETRETLEAIAGEIVAWEAAPGDRARLDSIFRFVHTVKGSCGFLDLPRLERLSHAAEDALAQVRSDARHADGALVTAVLRIIDRIGEIVEAIEVGGTVPDHDDDQLVAALSANPAAAEAAPVSAAVPATRAPARSIRLPVELLDRMMGGVSDMVLARNELFRRLREVAPDSGLEAAFDRLSTCVAEMRDAITRTRMQRIESLFTALPRMVRDLAADLGKAVALEIDGGDVELDREMIEMIRDPLTHIVRNAIDHGIESATDRIKARKPATGTLRICARQSGNQILIDIADDGRGIDGGKLVQRALAAGILDEESARRLSPAAQLDLIFRAGLSTASAVTAISGRGVGMDVVRANVERIGGVVEVDSRLGQGLRLTLRVPLTLTIIPALTVGSAGHQFAVPRASIEEIVRAGSGSIRLETLGGAAIANIRGRRLPVVSLAAVIGTVSETETTLVVLRQAGGLIFALSVESVHDHEELVVKPAAPAVMATGLYAGTTLPDNGRPMLLLDTAGLSRAGGLTHAAATVQSDDAPAVPERSAAAAPMLIFRDMDGAERGIRLALVERIEDVPPNAVTQAGGSPRVIRDDQVIPLASATALDIAAVRRILRLADGDLDVAYPIREVIDIAEVDDSAAAPGGQGSGGIVLVAGRPVELVDPLWLFAHADQRADTGSAPPLCMLRGADGPWLREILAPLVARAGYRVSFDGDDAAAVVVVIDADGAAGAVPSSGAPVLQLHRSPAEATATSIYRYDRAALVGALAKVRQEARR